MPPSNQPGNSRFLGESWASWSPEDADQATCIDSDDGIYSEMDFPLSNPSSAPDNTLSFDESPAAGAPPLPAPDASVASDISGPELIMPSIHEDYTPDGSWVVPGPSNIRLVRRTGPANSVNRTAQRRFEGDEKRQDERRLPRSPSSYLTNELNYRNVPAKSILIGILLLLGLYSIQAALFPSMIPVIIRWPFTSPAYSGPEANDSESFPPRYQSILNARSQLELILNNSSDSASGLPGYLKRSESAIVDACAVWTDDMGSKHEIEFECDNALVTIRQAKERSRFLYWRSGSVALDGLDRELGRMHRALGAASVDESDGILGRILTTFNMHSKKQPARPDLSQPQYRRGETAFELALGKQLEQAVSLQEALSSFQTKLQSIHEIASRVDNESGSPDCWRHGYVGDKTNSLSSILRNIKCTLRETLAHSFNSGEPHSAGELHSNLQSVMQKLKQADEEQMAAAIVANSLVSKLIELQGEWDAEHVVS
ncbi:hypothetical protein FQN53_002077 [Emmonsiellopsis sp. PD_33]|nr:hypothetical protein FQN53_002077 [Emmonsiellopsis sp. PD_33]